MRPRRNNQNSKKVVVVVEDKKLIIYDGDCGFCTKSLKTLGNALGSKAPKALPYQVLEISRFGITAIEARKEMKYIDIHGKIWGGAAAFRRVFYDSKGSWRLVAYFMALPLIKQLSVLTYRLIAGNRHNMPGASSSCSLPSDEEK